MGVALPQPCNVLLSRVLVPDAAHLNIAVASLGVCVCMCVCLCIPMYTYMCLCVWCVHMHAAFHGLPGYFGRGRRRVWEAPILGRKGAPGWGCQGVLISSLGLQDPGPGVVC